MREHIRDRHVHLEKHVVLGHTIAHTLSGLSAIVFLIVRHYPYYGSLDFSIIKSLSTLVFPLDFLQRYPPKNTGVHVCMIWFPIFCFH
jgi:hypothetical protein